MTQFCKKHQTHYSCTYCQFEKENNVKVLLVPGLSVYIKDESKQDFDILGLTQEDKPRLLLGDYAGNIVTLQPEEFEFCDPDVDYETAQLIFKQGL